MTVTYESKRYPALGFYVDGAFKRFSNGVYTTGDGAEIAILDALSDVARVPEASVEPAEAEKEVPATAEVKPVTTRKPAKASAK